MDKLVGPYTLGIAEKPQAANRLAWALDDKGKPQSKRINNVPVYICKREGRTIVIVPAIGHLFTLTQIGGTWNYPTLDFQWVPTYQVEKTARTKNFVETFRSLSSKANKFIVMTDYDREGEVIGYLILKYLLGQENAERMKFSTLTKRDILAAYEKKENSLSVGFLHAGLLRHYVDWLFGINFSRALSLAYQRIAKRFRTISIGRVQGPTLGYIVKKEKEIGNFVPVPYWTIDSEVNISGEDIRAAYEKSKINTLKSAQEIVNDCQGLQGIVADIKETEKAIYNFPPFNLSNLQREAYRHFKFSPKKTLDIAEKLYLKAIISYPRTDSQKLPMTLGHKQILTKLSKFQAYSANSKEILLNKKFKPYEGKRTDAAHPAIHPTGNPIDPKATPEEEKIYDLIVKRYLSLFARKATQMNKDVEISVNNHRFTIHGQQITNEGWIKYYKPYIAIADISLPNVKINSDMLFNYIQSHEHFTHPPQRFNESSLLKQMEDETIGTKATRADIISTLFTRGYMEGGIIKPTQLGMSIESVLSKQYDSLIKPDMTRQLEELMDGIQQGSRTIEDELMIIKRDLTSLLCEFHEKEEEIGLSLFHNLRKTEKSPFVIIGKCIKCDTGELRIIKSKKSGKRFVACSAYTDPKIRCDATYPPPSYGKITPTEEICPHDNLPLVQINKGRKKVLICISPDCPSRNRGN